LIGSSDLLSLSPLPYKNIIIKKGNYSIRCLELPLSLYYTSRIVRFNLFLYIKGEYKFPLHIGYIISVLLTG